MTVLSLDQSLRKTAYIVWEDGEMKDFGTIGAYSKTKEAIVLLQEVYDQTLQLILEVRPAHIVLEGLPYGMNSPSTRPLAAIYFKILELAEYFNISWHVVEPTSAKKTAGSGKFNKDQMVAALPDNVRSKFEASYKKTTGLQDLADSYWIYKTFEKGNI